MSSPQSTSSRAPTTTGRREGFTWRVSTVTLGPNHQRIMRHGESNTDAKLYDRFVREMTKTSELLRMFHLLDVDLDVLLEVVLEEVDDQVVHKVKPVAHNDQRQLVAEAGLLQKILHPLSVVVGALAANALDLLDLPRLASCFDVLEVHLSRTGVSNRREP
jgi:hypothetical protein